MLQTLQRFDYERAGSPVFIQSFDPNNLRQLRDDDATCRWCSCSSTSSAISARIAEYADAIGIAKSLATAAAVAAAHRHKLAVHVWTFRAENEFLPADLQVGSAPAAHGDLAAEIARYLERGIDGFFTDFPAVGVRVRDAYISARPARAPAAHRYQFAGKQTARPIVVAGRALQLQAVLAIGPRHEGRIFLDIDRSGVLDVAERKRRRIVHIELAASAPAGSARAAPRPREHARAPAARERENLQMRRGAITERFGHGFAMLTAFGRPVLRVSLLIRLAQVAFFAALLFTFYSAVIPPAQAMQLAPWDKAEHFIAFYGLTGLAVAAFPRRAICWSSPRCCPASAP